MPAVLPAVLARSAADDEAAARALLREVCAARAWIDRVLAGRPYRDPGELRAAGRAATEALTDDDLAEAMAAHPPIGRPKPGDPASAREQRGMAGASAALRAELLELNLAYQERFGHVFLICATGLSAERMRDACAARLGNTPRAERGIVRAELARINEIRLTRLTEGDGDPAPGRTEGAAP